jgi:phage shock protein A
MSKVTMALSAYDELKRQVEDYKTLAQDWERKAKSNEKNLNILVSARAEKSDYEDLDPFLCLPPIFKAVKAIPNRPLKEMMEALKDVEITNLRAQIKDFTIENEGLTKALAETIKKAEEWKEKYHSEELNTAAREAYQKLNRIKGNVDLLRHQLSAFRRGTWLRRKVRNKIESAENYLSSLLS